ncbi:hypothetical protein GBAR_LOCUS14213 [Geodia barretti]|uniref:Uncharacterized protein n=1 Tax=Geodia barretti TaxID=519541 RepID=A0AA35WK66_GEOBA|nr:hypothetical protein GBAR_LOCUS14213 [Geodia barretti]
MLSNILYFSRVFL